MPVLKQSFDRRLQRSSQPSVWRPCSASLPSEQQSPPSGAGLNCDAAKTFETPHLTIGNATLCQKDCSHSIIVPPDFPLGEAKSFRRWRTRPAYRAAPQAGGFALFRTDQPPCLQPTFRQTSFDEPSWPNGEPWLESRGRARKGQPDPSQAGARASGSMGAALCKMVPSDSHQRPARALALAARPEPPRRTTTAPATPRLSLVHRGWRREDKRRHPVARWASRFARRNIRRRARSSASR